ncbi:MAG: hypothetical protein CMM37_02360 [Rhodospirillaceae bacterium]|nr:hypothetical protein [Rhodospirillaceae bacterium]
MSNPRIPYQMSHERPRIKSIRGKNLIIQVIINVEHWQFDQKMPRKILTAPQGLEVIPDIPNYCWAEYGMRCGMPRIMQFFQKRKIPAAVSINASVINAYPSLAEEMLKSGWEFIGHGVHQTTMQNHDNEAEFVENAITQIQEFTGKTPLGWLSPGLRETTQTPDILKTMGIEYIFDWVLDDLPCWMQTKSGPLMALPYSLELNDSVIYAVEKHTSKEIFRRVLDTLLIFDQELDQNPKILTIAIHPHLMGVPHRFSYLTKIIDHLQKRTDTLFLKGEDIWRWYKDASPISED